MLKIFKYCLTIAVAASSMSLIAAVEYEIITLLPPNFDRRENPVAESSPCLLNDSGYVIGDLDMDPDKRIGRLYPSKGFVYHPDFGFKVISGSQENSYVGVSHVNDLGVCSGIEKKSVIDKHGNQQIIISAFTFDSRTDQFSEIPIQYPEHNGILAIQLLSDDKFWLIKRDFHQGYFSTAIFDNKIGQVIHSLPTISYCFGSNKDTCTFESCIYSAERGLEDLGSLDPYNRWPVETIAINNNNTVAGKGQDINNVSQGFIWSREKGFSLIPHSEGKSIDISAINSYDEVVGSIDIGSTQLSHAFIYSPPNGIKTLGTLGGTSSNAYDINDHSVVVGSSTIITDSDDERAFIWDKIHGMRDLNELIPSDTGYKQLTKTWKINNNGWIIGSGIYQGYDTGYLLIPREN